MGLCDIYIVMTIYHGPDIEEQVYFVYSNRELVCKYHFGEHGIRLVGTVLEQ